MTGKEIEESVRRYYERRDARIAEKKRARAMDIARYRARRAVRIALRELESLQKIEGEPLDFNFPYGKIRSGFTTDGGPGSGNFGHKGVPGQVGGSAPSGPAAETTKFVTTSGTMKITSDLKVKASKSGKVTVTIKAGSEITGIYSFAGKGSGNNLVLSGVLSKQYGGKPSEWGHLCGFATVVQQDGSERQAEIHWFEHDDIGQIKFKVKNR